jgi:hypothetical protein
MLASLEEIFCSIDDFCKYFDKNNQNYFLANSGKKRNKPCNMSLSEIMTIIILFHISHYQTFKYYYIDCVQRVLKAYFPKVVSYNRFVELMESSLMPLTIFLHGITGKETGIYSADSTTLDVCHIKREKRHKVFKGIATKGKNSMGWFFGLKLHLIINNEGELMACKITSANVDDRFPVAKLMKKLQGWLFADKGYLEQPIIK